MEAEEARLAGRRPAIIICRDSNPALNIIQAVSRLSLVFFFVGLERRIFNMRSGHCITHIIPAGLQPDIQISHHTVQTVAQLCWTCHNIKASLSIALSEKVDTN